MRRRSQLNVASAPFTRVRTLYLKQQQTLAMLDTFGIPAAKMPSSGSPEYFLAISVDRELCAPCVIASRTTGPGQVFSESKRFPFSYLQGLDDSTISKVATHLDIPLTAAPIISKHLQTLYHIFVAKEAFVLETKCTLTDGGEIHVQGAKFGFDDAAFKGSKRQADIHNLRDTKEEVPEEVEAEKDGIVYVRLEGKGSIGTLVNGAGLAMNTVDNLTRLGGSCANFLDTGGKATSETVKSSFRIILSDPRVRVIFVNVFGGLTLCDMIANGIIMAFRDLGMKVPVVVRLRGTNEEEGQKLIADSALPLHAFDKFEDAAMKVIELAKRT
ncbi:MAG: hypothetical protein M1834_001760 [Cirrosporium novae-zelandiae]|nr:MAG: hypothetical protein M1834_001760 [Cirrosporium novae-zelandiae]